MFALASQPLRRSARLASKAITPATPVRSVKQTVPVAPKKASRPSCNVSLADQFYHQSSSYRDQLRMERLDTLISVEMERCKHYLPCIKADRVDQIQWYSYLVAPLLRSVADSHADFNKVDHESLVRIMAFWAEDVRDLAIFKTMTPAFTHNWNKCANLLNKAGYHF
jgi:hypothetical protein